MSGHNDTFNVLQIRSHTEPALSNSLTIITSDPATRYPIGLTSLDYRRERNIRIRSYFDKIKFDESNETFSATIHLDAWDDSIMYSAACTWLPVSKHDREFQYEKVILKPDQLSHGITFGREYASIPRVVVWLNGFDVDKSNHWQLSVDTVDVTTKGFVLKGKKWSATILYQMEVTWIAYPASRPNIDSGRFHTSEVRHWQTPQHEHSKAVTFDKTFTRVPRVYFALNGVNSKHTSNLRLKAYVSDVTTQGMNVHLDSWCETNMHTAEGQWVAIQDL